MAWGAEHSQQIADTKSGRVRSCACSLVMTSFPLAASCQGQLGPLLARVGKQARMRCRGLRGRGHCKAQSQIRPNYPNFGPKFFDKKSIFYDFAWIWQILIETEKFWSAEFSGRIRQTHELTNSSKVCSCSSPVQATRLGKIWKIAPKWLGIVVRQIWLRVLETACQGLFWQWTARGEHAENRD